ncbi:MAG: LOG family protein [Acidimicrobiales bacterium]
MAAGRDLETILGALSAALAGTTRSPAERRQLLRLVESVADLVRGNASPLDVKIAAAALSEMEDAFEMFAPYRDTRKVTMFGSARIAAGTPIYDLGVEVASRLADRGFMVVTGAGPGLMEAGMVGAGRERSIGVSIRLPFETAANPVIADDDKHVSMRYFFTRKLMLMKESHGFVCMPGGFGTLDETFELLTLVQTGRSVPAPIVFLDPPDKPFWKPIMAGLMPTLLSHSVISHEDTGLYRITTSVDDAAAFIGRFYSNYHSLRHVDGRLVLRMERALPDGEVDRLRSGFSHLLGQDSLARSTPLEAEVRDNDFIDKQRLVLDYTGHGYAPLLPLIDAINGW